MLVLIRRMDQKLVIGEDEIVITVLGVNGKQVRIGIDAPTHVNIARTELLIDSEDIEPK